MLPDAPPDGSCMPIEIARGHLIGEVPGVKAHLECRGLILNGGMIQAIPKLEGRVDRVDLSHEAAIGENCSVYLLSE